MAPQVLTDADLAQALAGLPDWEGSPDGIKATFSFGSFPEAFAFLSRVAFLAESHGHHPEIFNVYSKVVLTLRTHDAQDKVTSLDIKLAQAISGLGAG